MYLCVCVCVCVFYYTNTDTRTHTRRHTHTVEDRITASTKRCMTSFCPKTVSAGQAFPRLHTGLTRTNVLLHCYVSELRYLSNTQERWQEQNFEIFTANKHKRVLSFLLKRQHKRVPLNSIHTTGVYIHNTDVNCHSHLSWPKQKNNIQQITLKSWTFKNCWTDQNQKISNTGQVACKNSTTHTQARGHVVIQPRKNSPRKNILFHFRCSVHFWMKLQNCVVSLKCIINSSILNVFWSSLW